MAQTNLFQLNVCAATFSLFCESEHIIFADACRFARQNVDQLFACRNENRKITAADRDY